MNDIENLDKRIKAFAKDNLKKSKISKSNSVFSDLIAGILTGGFIGYELDNLLTTKPLFFIICFVLGSVSSMWLIYKKFKG